MKILLDENIDVRFKKYFPDAHEVHTVQDMGWKGIKNGELLTLLTQNNFDCWIVVDKNIPYQQNITKLPCLIIVLDVLRNTLRHLHPLVPQVLEILQKNLEEKIVVVKL
jgi:predicted nuclease of predicted toxin-antitoxin system